MKRKLLSLVMSILAVILTCGVCVTAFADESAVGAETKPFFNYNQPGDYFTFDKETGVYTAEGQGSVMPRLTSVDGELLTVKDTYSDETIKFSYKYDSIYADPLKPSDWFMYFTFRNQDESPIWVSSYGAHLLFYQNSMKLEVRFNNESLIVQDVKHDGIYDVDFNFVDTGWHTVEINIDEDNGNITVYRDKGTDKEVCISTSYLVEYMGREREVIDTKGTYSFSVRDCKASIKDLYFFNSKNTEVDDEVARYEAYVKQQEEEENQNNQPEETEKNENNGCRSVVASSSVVAAFGLTTLGGCVLLRKKEN